MTQPNIGIEEGNNYLQLQNMNFNAKRNNKISELERQTIISNNLLVSKDNLKERQNTENEKKTEILNEIKINKFFIIFAFCCIRKRKNMNSIALEEGINLISKRLDVLNIFKRLYYDEKLQKDIIKGTEEVAMSERCKEKLS